MARHHWWKIAFRSSKSFRKILQKRGMCYSSAIIHSRSLALVRLALRPGTYPMATNISGLAVKT